MRPLFMALTVSHDLPYTHQEVDGDGGRRIVIATNRYVGIWEARNQPRSTDYPGQGRRVANCPCSIRARRKTGAGELCCEFEKMREAGEVYVPAFT